MECPNCTYPNKYINAYARPGQIKTHFNTQNLIMVTVVTLHRMEIHMHFFLATSEGSLPNEREGYLVNIAVSEKRVPKQGIKHAYYDTPMFISQAVELPVRLTILHLYGVSP